MFAALAVLALSAPFIYLLFGLLRAVVLFYPVMLGLGALHSHIPAVPPLGWAATFWLVFVISLLVPSNVSLDSD